VCEGIEDEIAADGVSLAYLVFANGFASCKVLKKNIYWLATSDYIAPIALNAACLVSP
jgi:hypothetical protein